MATTEQMRTLRIKTNVVDRLDKELASYVKELEQNDKKIEEIRASSDHSKLKQWENVRAETRSMIPDTKGRLQTAVNDLNQILSQEVFKGTDELEEAQEIVKKADTSLVSP